MRTRLSRTAWVWLVIYVVVALLDLVGEAAHVEWLAFAGLLLALPPLIVFLALMRPSRDRLWRFVSLALIFSWLGDWVGTLVGLPVKLGLFAVGHVFFVIGFWPYVGLSLARRWPVVLYAGLIAGLITWIAPHAGGLAGPVVGYGILLGTMAVLSTGIGRLSGVGGAIFVSSDLSIAIFSFVFPGRFDQDGLVIMSTYLVAQLLIALGVAEEPVVLPTSPTAEAARRLTPVETGAR